LTADRDTGEVSLLLDSGDTKDDLNLPNKVKEGTVPEDDEKLSKEICDLVDKGDKDVIVTVLEAPSPRPGPGRQPGTRPIVLELKYGP